MDGLAPTLPAFHCTEEAEEECASIKIIGARKIRLPQHPSRGVGGVEYVRQQHRGTKVDDHQQLSVGKEVVVVLLRLAAGMEPSDGGKHPAGSQIDRR